MEEDKMRRIPLLTIMFTLLFIANFALMINIEPVNSEPRTWMVDDDGQADFRTIQEAINAAREGDTIYVSSGIYHEHLVVNKPLTLVGQNKESTIVDGSGENQTVIMVTANYVVISRFTVQNSSRTPGTSYAGIKISGGLASNITGNRVTKNKIGILMTSQQGRIEENTIANNGQGIALYDSSKVAVEANNVTSNTVGISLALSFDNTIVGNRAANSSMGGHGITLSSNSFNNTIFANDLSNNYHGMWLSGAPNNLIVENTIANNNLLGIELASSPNNTFYHNNFVNNPTPIRIDNRSTSVWDDDYPSGGNYWNDYVDVDEKSGPNQDYPDPDGIWDNPYVITENNQDRYPSVKPYGEIPDITLDRTKPTANAGPDQIVNVRTQVSFDASRSADNVGIVSYEWDFGDGTTKTGLAVTHIYVEPGSFIATLTVRDAEGNFDVDFATITVNVSSPQDSSSWIASVTAAVMGIAIAIMLFARRRKYRHRRRSKRTTRKKNLK